MDSLKPFTSIIESFTFEVTKAVLYIEMVVSYDGNVVHTSRLIYTSGSMRTPATLVNYNEIIIALSTAIPQNKAEVVAYLKSLADLGTSVSKELSVAIGGCSSDVWAAYETRINAT